MSSLLKTLIKIVITVITSVIGLVFSWVFIEEYVKVPDLEIVYQEQYKIPADRETTYIFIQVKNNSGWDSALRCTGYVTIKSNERVIFSNQKVSWSHFVEEKDILRGGIEKLYLLEAKKRQEKMIEVFLAIPVRNPYRPSDYPAFRLEPGQYDIRVTVHADNAKWWSTPISQEFKLSLGTSWDTLTLEAKP